MLKGLHVPSAYSMPYHSGSNNYLRERNQSYIVIKGAIVRFMKRQSTSIKGVIAYEKLLTMMMSSNVNGHIRIY